MSFKKYLRSHLSIQQVINPSTKILVTGGTGFLGAYIIKELVEKEYRVRAIRRSSKLPFFIPQHILEKVEWVEGDVLDVVSLEDAMDGVETIIHAAGFVSFYCKGPEKHVPGKRRGYCQRGKYCAGKRSEKIGTYQFGSRAGSHRYRWAGR